MATPLVVDLAFVSKAEGFNIYEHDGKFYAMTAGDPSFCLEADTEADARAKGSDAVRFAAQQQK